MPERVVMLVPRSREAQRWRWECAQLCKRMQWRVVAITHDPVTARRYVVEGMADRVVAARPAHARQVRVPVSVVTDPPRRPPDPDRPRRLRPHEVAA